MPNGPAENTRPAYAHGLVRRADDSTATAARSSAMTHHQGPFKICGLGGTPLLMTRWDAMST